jgi:hypothetical protein
MIRRSTWISLILLVISAGLFWYMRQPENLIQKAMNGSATPTTPSPGFLIDASQGAISELTISNSDGKTVSLKRSSSGWTVTVDGEESAADQAAAEAAASQTLALSVVTGLENPPALNVIGLERPGYRLGVKFASGAENSFEIGNPTVTGDGYYVRTEDGTIKIVSNYSLNSLIGILDTPPLLATPTPAATEPVMELAPTSTP